MVTEISESKESELTGYSTKIWFRLIKVIYLSTFLTSLIWVTYYIWNERNPTRIFDEESSKVNCSNGFSYSLPKKERFDYSLTVDPNSEKDQQLRIFCEIQNSNSPSASTTNKSTNPLIEAWNRATPDTSDDIIEKNYTLLLVYDYSEYGHWLLFFILGTASDWVIFRILKVTFFYVLVGRRPRLLDFRKLL